VSQSPFWTPIRGPFCLPIDKQDFVYVAADDVYLCPAGEQLTYHYTNEEEGKILRRYWTTSCQACALKGQCTTGKERRISRWEHESVLEAVQARLDRNPLRCESAAKLWSTPSVR
jgi:Transposase DDE domain